MYHYKMFFLKYICIMQGQNTSLTNYPEILPLPQVYTLGGGGSSDFIYTVARFYRTSSNTNLVVALPLGSSYTSQIWYSEDSQLPTATFNSIVAAMDTKFIDARHAQINMAATLQHSIRIEYKLSKNVSNDGYKNMRKLQCLLTRDNGTAYNNSAVSYQQPGPNNRFIMNVDDVIAHSSGKRRVTKHFTLVEVSNRSSAPADNRSRNRELSIRLSRTIAIPSPADPMSQAGLLV